MSDFQKNRMGGGKTDLSEVERARGLSLVNLGRLPDGSNDIIPASLS
jgi:hypothetical protein